MKPTVNVLYLPGTNCHAETIRAFARAGASPRLVFLADVVSGADRIDGADILCIPGGFSFGDHLGAGLIAAVLLRTRLAEQFRACSDRPMIGICNGFQILTRAGRFGPGASLKVNDSGTFDNRPGQRHVVSQDNDSPWLTGLAGTTLAFPCAHGEGRFTYAPAAGAEGYGWQTALRYPSGENPDGSDSGIAGITSADGLAFGLMNHPERSADPQTQIAFFENGVKAAGNGRSRAPARLSRSSWRQCSAADGPHAEHAGYVLPRCRPDRRFPGRCPSRGPLG
jgi:phosphoribosylformylglycinamidine synthase subunit PurQ / glutaminase